MGLCVCAGAIPGNESIATGMEAKEMNADADIFWSREPITGPRGTKENPAIIPSFNDHRVVGLEIEQACAVALLGCELGCARRICISCRTLSCGHDHRRAALTARPSVATGRHLVQAGGGAAALRRRAVLQVRACPQHVAAEHTPPCLATCGQTIGHGSSRGDFPCRRLARMEGGEH